MPRVCNVRETILTTCEGAFVYPCGLVWVEPPRCRIVWRGWTPRVKCTPGTVKLRWCKFEYNYPCLQSVEVPGSCFDCTYTRYIRLGVVTFEICCENGRELLIHRAVSLRLQEMYCWATTLKSLRNYTDWGPCEKCQQTPDPLPDDDNPLAGDLPLRGDTMLPRSAPTRRDAPTNGQPMSGEALGLGDVVKLVLSRFGFTACESCERRRVWLNSRVPLRNEAWQVLRIFVTAAPSPSG